MSVIRSQCKDEAEYIQALRDDFAAKAMQSLVGIGYSSDGVATDVQVAYEIADAMLKEREK